MLKSTEAALELFPNQANVYYYNGLANLGKGNKKDAIGSFEQVALMAGKNNRLRLDAYILLGKTYVENNQFDAAKTVYLKAMPIGGENDAFILENLGDAYFKTNDVDNAVTYWQKAKVKGSKSSVLDKKIADRKI